MKTKAEYKVCVDLQKQKYVHTYNMHETWISEKINEVSFPGNGEGKINQTAKPITVYGLLNVAASRKIELSKLSKINNGNDTAKILLII